jgi:hypothetical protein
VIELIKFLLNNIFIEGITPPRIVCAAPCAVEKQTATLICEAGGMPPPLFLWFYGQVYLRNRIRELNFFVLIIL